MSDIELMRDYVEGNSESAFAELVRRHINFVYSVAWRFVGSSQDAQDVTQAVFIILVKKAASLRGRITLTGWLYETTRFAARQVLRTRARQQIREQEAYMQSDDRDVVEGVWREISPLLEEAMSRLSEKERLLVAFRFFENKSMAETAQLLGVREWTARKRIERALDKLQRFFARHGVNSTTAILAGAISANSVQAAPVVLVKTTTVIALSKGSTATAATVALVKGTINMITSTKTFTIAAVLTGAIFSQQVVASHFGLDGQANAWMPRSTYMLLSLLVGIGLPLFILGSGYALRFLPDGFRTLNIPHRDYWLAKERRDETFDYIFRYFLRLACLEAIFLAGFQVLMVQANRRTPPHLSMPLVWLLPGCLLTIVTVWQIAVFRHFNRAGRE